MLGNGCIDLHAFTEILENITDRFESKAFGEMFDHQ